MGDQRKILSLRNVKGMLSKGNHKKGNVYGNCMEDGNLGRTKRKIPLYDFLKKGGRASLFLFVMSGESQKTKERTSSAVCVGG